MTSEKSGNGSSEPSKVVLLEMDIDSRIVNVIDKLVEFAEFHNLSEEAVEDLKSVARWTYGKGYDDALKEPIRGKLHLDHGYKVP